MSSYDDDEALFDDIYGDDEKDTSKETKKDSQEEEKPSGSSEKATEPSTAENVQSGSTDNVKPAEQSASTTPQVSAPAPPATTAPIPSAQDLQNFQQMSANMQNAVPGAPMPPIPGPPGQGMPGQPPMPPLQPPVPASQMPPSNMGKESGKMFIGGLNWDTTEQGLVDYFTKFGEVIDHTIMRDNATGKSRGFGFLTFRDPSSVDEVIKTDHILDGKLIDPKRAIAREEQDKVGKIFVGGIDPMVNEKEFNDFFSQFGSIIDAQLMIDKDTGRSRGFGFITYDSPEAVDRVTVNKYLTLKGKAMEVKRAEPRGQHQQNQQQQQQQQQQQYGYNPYGAAYGQNAYQGMSQYGQGMNGMSPEMMQEYWQRMQQWYMYQQQQQNSQAPGQANPNDYSQQSPDQPGQPLNPQQQASEPQDSQEQEYSENNSKSNNNHHHSEYSNPHRDNRRMNLPKGPKRAPPSGPSGNSRGRGGYHNRNRGYHPYSRGNRR